MKIKFSRRGIICGLLAVFILFVLSACEDKKDEPEEISVYENGSENIKFYSDDTFVANLAHSVVKNGTYSENTDADGVKTVIYSVDDEEDASGIIQDGVLTIPEEWADDHGHGNTFTLK